MYIIVLTGFYLVFYLTSLRTKPVPVYRPPLPDLSSQEPVLPIILQHKTLHEMNILDPFLCPVSSWPCSHLFTLQSKYEPFERNQRAYTQAQYYLLILRLPTKRFPDSNQVPTFSLCTCSVFMQKEGCNCTVTVISIPREKRWWYFGCAKCKRSPREETATFWCAPCKCTESIPLWDLSLPSSTVHQLVFTHLCPSRSVLS